MNAWNEPAQAVRDFAQKQGIKYTILLNGGAVAQDYRLEGIPTTFYIDPEGKTVDSEVGYGGEAAMEKSVQAILGKKAGGKA